MPIGTLVNALAVTIGGIIGLALNKSLPDKIKVIVFQAIGLFTIVISLQIAFKTENVLILVFSLIIGGIIGELADLEKRIERLSDAIKSRLRIKSSTFTEGLLSAFLLSCIGSMTIVGSINEGLRGDRTLLLTKSILDGFSSIVLTSSLGIGVVFSVVPLVIFQGGITLLAAQFQNYFSPILINNLTGVGGVLILGIGINLLEIKKIKVTNLFPSLFVVAILVWILTILGIQQ